MEIEVNLGVGELLEQKVGCSWVPFVNFLENIKVLLLRILQFLKVFDLLYLDTLLIFGLNLIHKY